MKTLVLYVIAFFLTLNVFAQSKEERQVSSAVAELVKSILDGDGTSLERLTDEKLVYGHSSGKMESRDQFVSSLASGQSDFKELNTSNQTITVRGTTAVVRHQLKGTAVDNGKEGAVNLSVLMVWHKTKKAWKLLARQAVKI